jgi:MscS family membrane protein
LALALGAQKSLTNVFGAITIVLNKPFRIGDFVKIENTT